MDGLASIAAIGLQRDRDEERWVQTLIDETTA